MYYLTLEKETLSIIERVLFHESSTAKPYLLRAVSSRTGFQSWITRNVRSSGQGGDWSLAPGFVVVVGSVVVGTRGLRQILIVAALLGLAVKSECSTSFHVASRQLEENCKVLIPDKIGKSVRFISRAIALSMRLIFWFTTCSHN